MILLNLVNKNKQSQDEFSVFRQNYQSEDLIRESNQNLKTINFPELKSETFESNIKPKAVSLDVN